MLIGGEPYGSGVLGTEFDEESGESIWVIEFVSRQAVELVFYG